MSRVGNKIINVPAGVTVEVKDGNVVTVTGPKGTLTKQFASVVTIDQNDGVISIKRANEDKTTKQLHGTTRALLSNMVEGVNTGFKKELQIEGIGYRASMAGQDIDLQVGYSHKVIIKTEPGVTIETPNQTTIVISGIDKERVGEIAARIRAVRKPEPYKGKGIRYKDEKVIRKEGKTAGKK